MTGERYRTDRGDVVRLGPKVGGGGEATVYAVDGRADVVAKVYHRHRQIDASKLTGSRWCR